VAWSRSITARPATSPGKGIACESSLIEAIEYAERLAAGAASSRGV